jgi:hypothetical protein
VLVRHEADTSGVKDLHSFHVVVLQGSTRTPIRSESRLVWR